MQSRAASAPYLHEKEGKKMDGDTLLGRERREIFLSQDSRCEEAAEQRQGGRRGGRGSGRKPGPPNLITASSKALPSGEKRATLLIKRTYFQRHSGKGKTSRLDLVL